MDVEDGDAVASVDVLPAASVADENERADAN
jgi:DNA gyrase subunit A